jgi:hypothetical protein
MNAHSIYANPTETHSLCVCALLSSFVFSRSQEFFESFIGNFMKEEREAAVRPPCIDHDTQQNIVLAAQRVTPPQEVILCNILDVQSAGSHCSSAGVEGVVMH